jgi:hypothetical protein
MTWAELVAAGDRIHRDAAAVDPSLLEARLVAIGWATVDADRAFEELAGLVGGPVRWVPQEREQLLGARAWRRDPSPAPGVDLFVVEPDTEGRLAACLARFGEGVGAAFLASGSQASRVVPVHPRWGPFAIVRARSG